MKYLICEKCGCSFSAISNFFFRKICFNCFIGENKGMSLTELTDLYIFESYDKLIMTILEYRRDKGELRRFKGLLEENNFNLREYYLKFRNLNKSNHKKSVDNRERVFYEDKCAYCHEIIKINRKKMHFKCPKCGRGFNRLNHDYLTKKVFEGF